VNIMLIAFLIKGAWLSAEETSSTTPQGQAQQPGVSSPAAPSIVVENVLPKYERDFYQVLEDLISDFEFDIKNSQVVGLKDIAIRNVLVNENIPNSFKSHLELLITERILKTSKARIIQCIACKARKTTLDNDSVVVSSPSVNPDQLSKIAKMNGIANFLDLSFSYDPTGMILSLSIIDAELGNIVWSANYNSESSRAAAFRRGVDYAQIDKARREVEYVPTIQYRTTIYYFSEPDIGTRSSVLALGFRAVERYNNRHFEVGFEGNYMANASTIVNRASTNNELYKAFSFNLTMLFIHSWNFISSEENYNEMRSNITAGIGGTYASGFLGGLIRIIYEVRLAKHFATNVVLGYRPPAKAFLSKNNQYSIAGLEYGIGVSFLF
jgi:hypothetical protein